MIRETLYDDVFDAQRHFRVLLDAMARPGHLNRLAPIALTPPAPLAPGSVWIAFALLNADVHFHLPTGASDAAEYLTLNTGSRPAPAPEADFFFLRGTDSPAPLESAPLGLPAYPETGATVVLEVTHLDKSSAHGGLSLTLAGPGVETTENICVTGLDPAFLRLRAELNQEFPLGLDFILVTPGGQVACLPRTTRVEWSTL